MLGVAGVFGGSLFSAMHRFTSELCLSRTSLELTLWVNCRNSLKQQTSKALKLTHLLFSLKGVAHV
jgi:hypothetical protein